jgi:hypothetical protein
LGPTAVKPAAGAGSVRLVPNPHIDPWMSSSPGPFFVVRPGGQLDAVVSISIGREGRLLVVASWTRDSEYRSVEATFETFHDARSAAHQWADKLAAGGEPEY